MPAARQLAIPISHEAIARFCRKWGIQRLAFFGSVTRPDFDPQRSDIDVLVEFRDRRTPGLRFFATMPDELSSILGDRKIDLSTFDGLSTRIAESVSDDLIDEYVEVK